MPVPLEPKVQLLMKPLKMFPNELPPMPLFEKFIKLQFVTMLESRKLWDISEMPFWALNCPLNTMPSMANILDVPTLIWFVVPAGARSWGRTAPLEIQPLLSSPTGKPFIPRRTLPEFIITLPTTYFFGPTITTFALESALLKAVVSLVTPSPAAPYCSGVATPPDRLCRVAITSRMRPGMIEPAAWPSWNS